MKTVELRPRVLGVLLLLALVTAAVVFPAAAFAEPASVDYRYWYSYMQNKVLPTTLPPANASRPGSDAAPMGLSAAQAEFEGRQISLRSATSKLRDIWIEASDFEMTDASGTVHSIPGSNVSTYKVWYVNITHPSYPFKVKGLQPDPLLPMTLANGERLGWQPPASPNLALRGMGVSTTQPFYVLFKVPRGAVPGKYTGTLKVTAKDSSGTPAPDVMIPVTLTVYPFSVAQRTLKTAFAIDAYRAMLFNSPTHKWTGASGSQMMGWLKYMSDHRISSEVMIPAWSAPAANGTMSANHDVLADLMGTGMAKLFVGDQLAFNTLKMPEYYPPAYIKNPFSSTTTRAQATQYYKTMYSELGPFKPLAYAYPIDEPPASQRAFVEKYASFIHSTVPGVKFLLTTDPVTQQNRLVSGVDIYVERLQFFFRESSWISKIKSAKKQVWIYSHRSAWQGQVPVYLIDRPLADSRVQGWFAYRAGATGLMHWSINCWRVANTTTSRDPYLNPVSGIGMAGTTPQYNNGDGSLVYPGYYPALGLHVAGAPPVGSLRMEAVRDGLEDYEYVRLVGKRYGSATASGYVNRIIGPLPVPAPGKLMFPKFQTTIWAYESARSDMAAALSK